jgi:holo-[acyl-carrier protein] synthase
MRVGIDVVEIARIAALERRFGERFLRRVYTPDELADCACRPASLAARWAAKEAAAKVLGTGIGDISWRDLEVVRDPAGQPALCLHGPALAQATKLGLTEFALSLSHTVELAIAIVVAL